MLVVKYQPVIDCLQLSDTKTRDDEKWGYFQNATFFLIFWVKIGLISTQNLWGWKQWEKLTPFDEILR